MSSEIINELATEKNALVKQLQRRDLYIDYLLGKLNDDRSVLAYDDWEKLECSKDELSQWVEKNTEKIAKVLKGEAIAQ